MGLRGKHKQPASVLRLRGERHQNAIDTVPLLPIQAPSCPDWLQGIAREEWDRVIPLLLEMGQVAEIDQTMLAMYCASFAEWRETDRDLLKTGKTIQTKK